ncbi:MAG: response regulator [Nitrospirae bacterium]|nr:response regulator [Nitrospirota bacterium]
MARKLLLADDSITIQKVVELVLAEEDFEIKSVSNGEDALKILSGFNPDIVLADIEMPKVNGYQLCDRIKKNPETSHIPVILLAGAFEPIDEELSREVAADDSVIKPFESQELISKINAALTMSAAVSDEYAVPVEAEMETEAEALAEADEDVFELVEETAGEPAETVATADDDLWSMEEIPEAVAEVTEVSEEAAAEEAFALPEETPAAEPVFSASVEEAVGRRSAREVVMGEVSAPSKEEMMAVFERTVNDRVTAFLSSVDIRETILTSLMPAMKESVEKVLWEVAPELAEKMLKEILKGSISSLTAQVEKVIWETVPDLAGSMISKEIEKIKAEF